MSDAKGGGGVMCTCCTRSIARWLIYRRFTSVCKEARRVKYEQWLVNFTHVNYEQ